jgi:two-component system, LytTR family, response regulator
MHRHPPGSPSPTAKLRVLIVDDEPLARDRVRALLRLDPSVEIAGECANGPDALVVIQRDKPDIVFLDVQMPGCDGLQVAAQLPAEHRPAIVFVTAHEQFAVEAFAAEAVDYLLKPFDSERLQLALQRAVRHINRRRVEDLGARVETLLANASAAAATPERNNGDRLAFRAEGRIIFLKPEEIVWVEAANNYSILHLADTKRLMLRETLSALEERLRTFHFARINRSALVRIEEVRELQPANYGDYVVVLRNGLRLPLSRSLRGRFEEFVAKP